jgi:2-aminoethylphosphonate-pyruvate transaminase
VTLFTPGPCRTTKSVREAAAADLNHREPEFLEAYGRVRRRLTELSGGLTPHILAGSGTSAVEAMLTSCVGDGRVLAVVDGYYSGRAEDILRVHNIPHDILELPWLEAWNLDQIKAALDSEDYEAIVCTHHETTSGRLNPVEKLAEMTDAKILVDAMSSFGADPLDFSRVQAVAASAGKCLRGLPGVSFVLMNGELPDIRPRTWSLNLSHYASDKPPVTAAVQPILSLDVALKELIEEGGFEARRAEILEGATRIRKALRSKGYDLPIPDDSASCAVTLASIPGGKTWREWSAECLDAGFMVYGCKGELQNRYFQISTMGAVTDDEIDRLIAFLPNA